jgi:hypothetical protein
MGGVLEVAFDASGAAAAGARGRVVAVIDVVDSATTAEAALAAGATDVFGAAPHGATPPVRVRPEAVAARAAAAARRRSTDVVVVVEPRISTDEERRRRARPVLEALEAEGVGYEVVPNQGAEVSTLVKLLGRVVIIVSAAGGVAFDAALNGGAAAVCFATTARVARMSGWEVARLGASRAMELASQNGGALTIVAASANSTDDCLAAFEVARAIIDQGFLR